VAISLAVAGGAPQVRAAPAQAGTARTAAAPAAAAPPAPAAARAAAGFVRLSGSPGAPAANPATGTLYVPVQCATAYCAGAQGHVLDIISTARCNARVTTDCRVIATANAGTGPTAVTIDQRTDTVYVMDGTGNVTVLNGARCNARVTSGCGRPVATVKVGLFPVAGVVDPVTRTLYVANLGGGFISVINIAACNARDTRGCGDKPRSITDKAGPGWLDVDVATDTVYVANSGSNTADTVSVMNGAACNGRTGTGCARTPATVTVGPVPFGLAVDQASDTIYVSNFSNIFTGSVSVFSGARCNGRVTSGCRRAPATVPTGSAPGLVAVDPALHTAFVVNSVDDTLSAINTRTCDGTVTSGCARRPPDVQATLLQGPGYGAFPNGFALDPGNGTAYVVNIGGDTVLSVTGIGRCNATDTAGCRAEAPSVPDNENVMTADPATHTIYAGNASLPQIDVINSATCHAGHRSGCSPVATIPTPHPGANVGAIDEATHTLYASDASSSGALLAINTSACTATDTAGCAAPSASVQIGAFPNVPVLDPATHTVYVSYGDSANKIAVVDAATCNATDTAGCGQTPAVVSVGAGTAFLAVSVATDTVYGANSGGNGFNGDTVSVLNGATCNAANNSGCGHLAATAKVGTGPFGIVADDAMHTLYVVNNANGDAPGTVSVLNIATCDGTHTAGCHARFPKMATGNSPLLAVLDPANGLLYVADFSSAEVTILNTARCNARVTVGCAAPPRQQAVGSNPYGIAVNPANHTVYVAQQNAPGSMAVFGA
jgi:DNA-binding beta-propeller fold protein YncE